MVRNDGDFSIRHALRQKARGNEHDIMKKYQEMDQNESWHEQKTKNGNKRIHVTIDANTKEEKNKKRK